MPSNVPTGAPKPDAKGDDRVKIIVKDRDEIKLLAVAALALLALLVLALCVVVRKCFQQPQNNPMRELVDGPVMAQQVPIPVQLQPDLPGLELRELPKQAYSEELHVAVAVMQNYQDNEPRLLPAPAGVDEETLDPEAIAIAHPN